MAYKIKWTERALSDLEAIAAFISIDSPFYAAMAVDRILSSIERAKDFPLHGRKVPEFNIKEIREVFWRNYRIVYKITDNEIIILTIFHGYRLIPSLKE